MMGFVNKDKYVAVVGATANPEKYGYKILNVLKEAGYKVIPINLKEKEILGLRCFSTLKEAIDAVKEIDLVDMVVPPSVTERIVEECAALHIKRVWMQPGSESEKAIAFCEQHNIECIHHSCIMVNRES